jgi:hypothetical protein
MSLKRFCSTLGICCIMYSSYGAAAARRTPEDLARLWVEAIRTNSPADIRPLVHPGCPQASISAEILARMVEGGLPETYEIETRELGSRAELERAYEVIPEKQLNLKYRTSTSEDRAKYGIGKGFPIAKANDEWFFVICRKSA